MRRFASRILLVVLVCSLVLGANTQAWTQSPRTAPLPVRNVARQRLFQKRQAEDKQQAQPKPKSPIPQAPPGKQQTPVPAGVGGENDTVLPQVKQAIETNKLRYLTPNKGNVPGHTPWMIMHGVLALRDEYQLKIDNQLVSALDYITKRNPVYQAVLPDPQRPGNPLVPVQSHWFEATAHGGRAQPYVVSFAFEGHTNQFLAILSMSNLPLTHEFVVNDPKKPGASKTITMADMVRHAKLNVHIGNPNEIAWTLWFLANYLEADEKWLDKDGQPWSMEQLVIAQTNAPLFSGAQDLAPCGGTHGLFSLACACNSYQAKFGKLQGAWLAARQKLDNHIEFARRGQNRDGSFSTEFFKANGYSPEMGPRFKSSGHMLEWLMMALPPERLKEQWVQSAVMSVANDLVRWGGTGLDTGDTGAMYHALHAMVLYRNRIEPPTPAVPPTPPAAGRPPQVAELPPEMKNPAPGEKRDSIPPVLPKQGGDAPIRLLNPAMNKLSPLGSVRPMLRPITNSRETDEKPEPALTPEPPPLAEKIVESDMEGSLLVPTKPELEQPAPSKAPAPVPGEPKSEAAVVTPLKKEAGGTVPVPLSGGNPLEMKGKSPLKTAETSPKKPSADKKPSGEKRPPLLIPALPEPSPAKSPSSSD